MNPLTTESIVFFGSGPVAAASLRLLAKNFIIEAVVTKPQPSHHHEPFPVLTAAKELGLSTLTPASRQELSTLFETKPVTSRLGVVIDYGFIINQDVIDYFSLGIVNSHFSLLPEWRGADPITFSILSGQKQTGVSLMLIVEKMDEGPLLAEGVYDIEPAETTPSLTNHLIKLSDALLSDVLPRYVAGSIKPAPQEWVANNLHFPATPTYSRKLSKDDGILDWSKPAEQLEREIRAFIEWPKSRTQLADKDVVVTNATVIKQIGEMGSVVIDGKRLLVFCKEGALQLNTLKPAGKAEMSAEAFIAGYGRALKSK